MTREYPNEMPERDAAAPADAILHTGAEEEAREARLTAYVLGELDDAERGAVEAEVARSETLRAALDAIRESAALMTAALAREPAGALAESARNQLERKIDMMSVHVSPPAAERSAPWRRSRLFQGVAVALAASLLLALIGLAVLPKAPERVASRQDDFDASDLRSENAVLRGSQSMDELTDVAELGPFPAKGSGPSAMPADGMLPPQPEPLSTLRIHGVLEDSPAMVSEVGIEAETKNRLTAAVVDSSSGTPGVLDPKSWRNGRFRESIGAGGSQREARDGEEHPSRSATEPFQREAYDRIVDNPFLDVRQNPLSTFSIDVDTASYANVRRFLNQGALPPKDAVRIEELVNYFKYHYAPPADDAPFAVHAMIAGCPWEPKHRLLRVALKGREIDFNKRPAGNLVFLIDVSGSMDEANKLPLLKGALRLLIDRLGENDRVAMVVYAGSTGLVLPSTTGDRQAEIASALEQLQAGGSTNGGEGIQLAYDTARRNFIRGGTNRVILCTDGDFNVGITDQGALTRLIEDEAKSGVFLSVLGFGAGNYQDSTMEKLADRGNGNYAYIDNLNEARKTLVEQAGGTLMTIAKDVKLQLEFNPRRVAAYRLIGYENRLLRNEDFNDDAKDAGEIGAGHTVTAFYELVPAGSESPAASVDPLKYQRAVEPTDAAESGESLTLKLRYKEPDGQQSKLLTHVVQDAGAGFGLADEDFQFAAAVAAFGMLLRESPYKGSLTYAAVLELAAAGRSGDAEGYRAEFIELVRKAQAAAGK